MRCAAAGLDERVKALTTRFASLFASTVQFETSEFIKKLVVRASEISRRVLGNSIPLTNTWKAYANVDVSPSEQREYLMYLQQRRVVQEMAPQTRGFFSPSLFLRKKGKHGVDPPSDRFLHLECLHPSLDHSSPWGDEGATADSERLEICDGTTFSAVFCLLFPVLADVVSCGWPQLVIRWLILVTIGVLDLVVNRERENRGLGYTGAKGTLKTWCSRISYKRTLNKALLCSG